MSFILPRLRQSVYLGARMNKSVRTKQVRQTSTSMDKYKLETLSVTNPKEYVYQVELNRPKKLNAMNRAFWKDMVECFKLISEDQDCRVVVITGAGRAFSSGLDLMDFADLFSTKENEVELPRRAFNSLPFVRAMQETFTCIEKCPRPVIAAINGPCIGGGIDLTTACDIRYCTQDAIFQVKEVDIGLAADVGTLQRFPKIVGNDSLVRELAYTARKFSANEAKDMGLVSRILPDKETLLEASLALAAVIAEKSPVAVQGSKVNMVYSRDHSVQEGLDYVSTWNSTMLLSEDVMKAAMAGMQKTKAVFSKL